MDQKRNNIDIVLHLGGQHERDLAGAKGGLPGCDTMPPEWDGFPDVTVPAEWDGFPDVTMPAEWNGFPDVTMPAKWDRSPAA